MSSVSLAGRTRSNFTIVEEINRRDFIVMALVCGDMLSAAIARGQPASARAHGPFNCWKVGDPERDRTPEAARKLQ
jgi:hypothetical protein